MGDLLCHWRWASQTTTTGTASTGATTLNRLLLGAGEKPAINQKVLQEFIVEFICNSFAEFIAGFVAEIQPVKMSGDVRKNVRETKQTGRPGQRNEVYWKTKCRLCGKRSLEHSRETGGGNSLRNTRKSITKMHILTGEDHSESFCLTNDERLIPLKLATCKLAMVIALSY